EKDRNRRYETANGFAMDVQRYLADEPVLACPPSAGYRFRKFVRRHKAALTMASVIAAAVLLVVGGFGWMVRDREAQVAERARERQTQQEMIEREVKNAVMEANRLQGESKWAQALSWVTRAEGILAHGGRNEELRQRVHALRADLEMV